MCSSRQDHGDVGSHGLLERTIYKPCHKSGPPRRRAKRTLAALLRRKGRTNIVSGSSQLDQCVFETEKQASRSLNDIISVLGFFVLNHPHNIQQWRVCANRAEHRADLNEFESQAEMLQVLRHPRRTCATPEAHTRQRRRRK